MWFEYFLILMNNSSAEFSNYSKWFQDKAGERKIKEDGPVSRLKSAGPRGRSSYKVDGQTCKLHRELPVSKCDAEYFKRHHTHDTL